MSTGRPSFQIDPRRLRDLRKEMGLTQGEVSRCAHRKLGKSEVNESVAVKHYQRIERWGKTSKAMAQALAEVLDTTVAVLQGDAPDQEGELVDRVERQLRDQVANGQLAMSGEAAGEQAESHTLLRDMALNVAHLIEALQLGHQREEMATLIELTGWSEQELLRPASLQGHWLVSSTIGGVRSTEVMLGAGAVLWHIEHAVSKHLPGTEGDSVISLRAAPPWLHVEFRRPRWAQAQCAFSLVRCQATPTGLQWVNPTWRDRYWLDGSLHDWAYRNANFVASYDGEVWPRDLMRIRMLIEMLQAAGDPCQLALIRSDLDEQAKDWFGDFVAEGNGHVLAVNWLTVSAWDVLAPHLSLWPSSCWNIQARSACVALCLATPLRIAAMRGLPPDAEPKYRLRLVEEDASGELRPLPWRTACVEVTSEALRKRLVELDQPVS